VKARSALQPEVFGMVNQSPIAAWQARIEGKVSVNRRILEDC
jgi:hypothetical protein